MKAKKDLDKKIVISASRRTDIPAFYMDWFMERLGLGTFETPNPYNNRPSIVPAQPAQVHTIVFWSKNFEAFIKGHYGEKLLRSGYHLFFNFTVNSASLPLEPNLPPLEDRLGQFQRLAELAGPDAVQWRFDPICFFHEGDGRIQHNMADFKDIAAAASQCGIRRCVTSFMDHYRKIEKRAEGIPGFSFHNPPLNRKVEILSAMETELSRQGITLYTCCEKEVLESLPSGSSIRRSACIPGHLLVKLYGGMVSMKQDLGQRYSQGCGCTASKDIGSYRLHPCFHNCLFCYANPVSDESAVRTKRGRPHLVNRLGSQGKCC